MGDPGIGIACQRCAKELGNVDIEDVPSHLRFYVNADGSIEVLCSKHEEHQVIRIAILKGAEGVPFADVYEGCRRAFEMMQLLNKEQN